MSLAVVIIASEKRRETTFPACLESVRVQEPDELVVVADFPVAAKGVSSLVVPPMTRTTVDALVKRDVGTLATTSENILYLCDDHRLGPAFVQTYRDRYNDLAWGMLCPFRYTVRPDHTYALNVGRAQGYVGGHGGIYRREWIQRLPWSAGPHHPNWDVLFSHALQRMGASLLYADQDLAIEDIEPGASPWL